MKFVSYKHKHGAIRGDVLEGSVIHPLTLSSGDDLLAHRAHLA
jgi:hypothetical protein